MELLILTSLLDLNFVLVYFQKCKHHVVGYHNQFETSSPVKMGGIVTDSLEFDCKYAHVLPEIQESFGGSSHSI